MQEYMFLFWLVVMGLFIAFEVMTYQIVSMWFAVGAVAATFASVFNMGLIGQLTVFLFVSVLSLAIGKPLVKKYVHSKVVPTNADRCIGQEALVTQEIDNIKQTGQANIKGAVWTARSVNGETIENDSIVIIDAIEGVKLMVHKK